MKKPPQRPGRGAGASRGRPSHASIASLRKADAAIAQAVYWLDGWGYVLRPSPAAASPDGVLECVAQAALEVLKRSDANGLALSAKRVEQLYRNWLKAEYQRWYQNTLAEEPDSDVPTIPRQDWSRYMRESRRGQLPPSLTGFSLVELATHVLEHGGSWETAQEESEFALKTGIVRPGPDLTIRAVHRLVKGPLTARFRRALEHELAPRKRGRPKKT